MDIIKLTPDEVNQAIVGYYFDQDTPYYEGIQLNVKAKNQTKKLSKLKNNKE